jgi:Putative prokaryotic signal transducing protein
VTKEIEVQEILRTNDPVVISYVRSLLMDAGIESVEFDSHIANLEGSVTAIPCRLMVIDADVERALATLADSKLDW